MIDLSFFFTPETRAKRYRRFAAEARNQAATCTGAMSSHHLLMADEWDAFGAEIETALAGGGKH